MYKEYNIYVCGDTHGDIDTLKISQWQPPPSSKPNLLFQLGDWGGLRFPPTIRKGLSDNTLQRKWLKWGKKANFTLLVVPGNHENWDLIKKLPVIEMFGARVSELKVFHPYKKMQYVGSIYLTIRGEIYTINGKTFFTFGGASSPDKASRTPFIDWWAQELPTYGEESYALENLSKYNNCVDYILTHTGIASIMPHLLPFSSKKCSVSKFLDEIEKRAQFKEWHFGHLHKDVCLIYNDRDFYCHYKASPHLLS